MTCPPGAHVHVAMECGLCLLEFEGVFKTPDESPPCPSCGFHTPLSFEQKNGVAAELERRKAMDTDPQRSPFPSPIPYLHGFMVASGSRPNELHIFFPKRPKRVKLWRKIRRFFRKIFTIGGIMSDSQGFQVIRVVVAGLEIPIPAGSELLTFRVIGGQIIAWLRVPVPPTVDPPDLLRVAHCGDNQPGTFAGTAIPYFTTLFADGAEPFHIFAEIISGGANVQPASI